jgi:tetratricopeptide (TPR) repeat protein
LPNQEKTHPTSTQRAVAVSARLRQVKDQADLFRIGLMFYQTGKYENASKAFGEFLRYFPGREVYHNSAASYHQLALNYYQYDADLSKQRLLPFHLPVMADPYTRAVFGASRSKSEDRLKFEKYIKLAIEYYLMSIDQDDNYTLAYQNLASAYLLNDEPYKAIATLKDIATRSPENVMLLNVFGVGFYLTGNLEKANSLLRKTIALKPNFSPAYYNLGRIAWLNQDKDQALTLWQKFIDINPNHQWSRHLVSNFNLKLANTSKSGVSDKQPKLAEKIEIVKGVEIGNYIDEIPGSWGRPQVRKFAISDAQHSLLEYKNGVALVMEGDEVRIIVANNKYSGKSKLGVNIGSSQKAVVSHYGVPDLNIRSAQGRNLVYPRDGISFQLSNDKVVSWSVY